MPRMKLKSKKPTLKRKSKEIKVFSGKENEVELFNLGMLLHFETHAWRATKTLSDNKVKDKFGATSNGNWIKANKSLINKKKLTDLNSYVCEARRTIESYSLPFPIKSVHLIPHSNIEELTEKLSNINEKFKEEADKFSAQYEEFIADAEENLSLLGEFNRQDYPDTVRDKFSITWRFFEMTLPKNITESIYEEETEKFKSMMKETREMGILALREGFSELVNHLTEKLMDKENGKDNRIHQNTVDKISTFFNEFQNKNIFKDVELENLINKAKVIVDGVQVKELNSDNNFAKKIKQQLEPVKNELDKSIKVFRRRISL